MHEPALIMRRIGAVSIAAALAAFSGVAAAQDATLGDAQAGLAYALDRCAACHAVEAASERSPAEGAPPFQAIADTPGMTGRALTVWLTTFHPDRTMPALVIEVDDREDLIAYILSLAES